MCRRFNSVPSHPSTILRLCSGQGSGQARTSPGESRGFLVSGYWFLVAGSDYFNKSILIDLVYPGVTNRAM